MSFHANMPVEVFLADHGHVYLGRGKLKQMLLSRFGRVALKRLGIHSAKGCLLFCLSGGSEKQAWTGVQRRAEQQRAGHKQHKPTSEELP